MQNNFNNAIKQQLLEMEKEQGKLWNVLEQEPLGEGGN